MKTTTMMQWTKETETTEEREFKVSASISGGHPGRYYGAPEDCYPAEDPEMEDLEGVWVETGLAMTDAELLEHVDTEELMDYFAQREW